MSTGEGAGEMTTTIAERIAAGDATLDALQARIQAETDRLDAKDAENERAYAVQRARLAVVNAETRATVIKAALQAAQGERDGYPATWDYRATLAEYGVDEYGWPVDDEVPHQR